MALVVAGLVARGVVHVGPREAETVACEMAGPWITYVRFGGTDIDGVSGLPETAGGVTMAEIDRSVRAEDRRDTRAELRALRTYWQGR